MAGKAKALAVGLCVLIGACKDDDEPSNGQLAASISDELAEGLRTCDLISSGKVQGLLTLWDEVPRPFASCIAACYRDMQDSCAELESVYCGQGSDRLDDCVDDCEKVELSCTSGGGTYRVEEICDGLPDCEDRTDEKGCLLETGYCDDGQELVSGSTAIICDGHSDCDDDTDERDCPEPVFCEDGQLVSPWFVCDGEEDCEDGADEQGCAEQGDGDSFECEDGQDRVPAEYVCDLYVDCSDGSDERQGCAKLNCPSSDCLGDDAFNNPDCFETGDGLGDGFGDGFGDGLGDGLDDFVDGGYVCLNGEDIPDDYVCDEVPDCDQGEDEEGCVTEDPQLSCGDGSTYFESEQCDGVLQCVTFSDEQGCGALPFLFDCGGGNLQPISYLCDGDDDCLDGRDESATLCPNSPLGFACGNGTFVEQSAVCDGSIDCVNGSDEAGVGCGSWACGDGQYIAGDAHCDGFTDCLNGADEASCE